jgi:PPOX class probable F420-dependent enzyme
MGSPVRGRLGATCQASGGCAHAQACVRPRVDTCCVTIANAPCAWLTTLRRDGSPHTTPVWFLLMDETFWIASSTANVKVKNVLHDPRVSLAVDGTGNQPYVAQGRVTVHPRFVAFPHLLTLLAEKYDGWDAADESQDGPRVLLEVPVDRWLLGQRLGIARQ